VNSFSLAQTEALGKLKATAVSCHLGDINISTAPQIVEAISKTTADCYTDYCPGREVPQRPEALAEELGIGPAGSAAGP